MRNLRPHRIAILVVLLLAGSALAQSSIRFVNWASAEEATRQNIETVIEAFEAEHPDVEIVNEPIPFGQMRQQLITQTAGGNPPCVMQVSGNLPFELAAFGALEPLGPYLGDELRADLWPAGLDAGTFQDETVALPWGLNIFGFWYNKDLMEQAGLDPESPPATWEEFQRQLDTVKENLPENVDAFELFTAMAQYGVTHNWSLFWEFGAFPLENGEIGVDTPEFRAYLEWMRSMVQDGYTTSGFKLREFREEFATDQLVFGFDGPYMKGIVQSLNPDIDDDTFYERYGVTTLPVGVTGEPMVATDIHQLAMANDCQDKQAAWDFMNYLISSEAGIVEYLVPYGSIPPRRSTVESEYAELFQDPISQAYIDEIIPTARPIPYDPDWGEAAEPFMNAIQEAVLTERSIDQIVADLDSQLTGIYGE